MPLQHHLPSKVYYLDRLGNMSTSSCIGSSSGSVGGSSSCSSASSTGNASIRKQILPLKPKQPNSYVQHLEIKSKFQDLSSVPVTMLELKKKDKSEKNVVTTLVYRKPSGSSSATASEYRPQQQQHHLSLIGGESAIRRPGSPSSSGYETDSLVDQENCDVFSNLLSTNAYSYGHHHQLQNEPLDMLHSHPIWSPQPSLNNNSLLMANLMMSSGQAVHGNNKINNNNNNNNNLMMNNNLHHVHLYAYAADHLVQ
ncbi:unnamed protein product [Caenorhabditis sp. 36 PRJEB53466]|nr:unnamed protein product [Caenorhabditis sp. 36 PRJEB53466]